jgi:hypothetical protein
MHRVELKDLGGKDTDVAFALAVPNAPCGVESGSRLGASVDISFVPNAPCGVERLATIEINNSDVIRS